MTPTEAITFLMRLPEEATNLDVLAVIDCHQCKQEIAGRLKQLAVLKEVKEDD